VYLDHPELEPHLLHGTLRAVGTMVMPTAQLAALLVLVAVSTRRLRRIGRGRPPVDATQAALA
jgi:hypothetical protein